MNTGVVTSTTSSAGSRPPSADGRGGLRDIVCLSTQPWDGPRFRKQRFMIDLAGRGHRVVLVEPSRSILRRGWRSGGRPDPRLWGYRSRMTPEGVWVVTPAALPPKPSSRAGSWLGHLKMAREIRAACDAAGVGGPVVWVYDPRFAPFVHLLRPSAVVFDLADDYAGYPYTASAARAVAAYTKRLCDTSDRVILTSAVLAATYRPRAPWRVVPNGFDDALFRAPAEGAAPEGAAPAPRRRRRAGFVGALFGFLDYDLLLLAARCLPAVDFVLAGRRQADAVGLDALLAEPNVSHLGFVPPHEVPRLIRSFDVCLCPFKVDRASRAVSPLKVYEYLAAHRPVVSMPMEGLQAEPVARYVDFAETSEQFVSLVQQRAADGRAFDDGLDEVLAQSTWEARSRRALDFVEPVLREAGPACA